MEDPGGKSENQNVHSENSTMDENQSVCHLCNKKFPTFDLEMHFLECQTQVDNGSQNKSQDSNPVIITIPQFQLPKLSELNQRPSGSKTLAVYKDGSFGFRCEICNKVLRDSWSLKVHFRTHTGDKPYKCDLCPKSLGKNHTCLNIVQCI